MHTILLMLAAVLPPPMPDLPPVVDLDPQPVAMCVVCKDTGFVIHGDGMTTPCPEDHASAQAAKEYMVQFNDLWSDRLDKEELAAQLAAADEKHPKSVSNQNPELQPSIRKGCQCQSGGDCTCNGDCDCEDCQCEHCPGKTSYDVLLPVCNASGCKLVRTKATRKGKLWYAENAGRWHIWKGGKWVKIKADASGSYRIERPVIKPMTWQAQPLSRSPGQHSHRCGMCGHTWSHYPGQSHRCPDCGGLTDQNYDQINSSGSGVSRYVEWPLKPRRTIGREVTGLRQQPRRMFASRGG